MLFNALFILPAVMFEAFFLAIIFISQYPLIKCWFNLKCSRTNRLTLLRVTADPTFLETVIPIRVLSKDPGKKMTIKFLVYIFLPFSDNLINS